MFNDKTSLILCTVTAILFIVGVATDWLSHPVYIGINVLVYLIVIINVFMVKKPEDYDDNFFEKENNI